MHHYPFHPGDYMLDTAHLSLEEDATYRRLLDFYYVSEQPIPLETESVSRRLRVGSELVARVLAEFFEKRENGWHHARCDAEIAKYQAQAERARANGKRGGRPHNQGEKPTRLKVGSYNKPKANPEESKSKANQEPRTKNQEPIKRESNAGAWPSLEEVKAHAQTVMAPAECAERFWNECEAAGWLNRHGQPIADWRPLFRNYATSWKSRDFVEKQRQKNGFGASKPKHAAYDSETATLGLTADQIGKF